ncbi:MAG: nicotinate-nicotinamide nucleotide adenylyltransferase [Anaerolineae bacterium]|nr:nicotinate-nicotinamide nucleotide adenylyltransferase [Anaerolineae bacterium]
MTRPTLKPRYRLVFGLSADPVHAGHIETVVRSAGRLIECGYDLAEVLLVPVYRRNPVGARKGRLPETYPHRYEMCRLAAQEVAARLQRDKVKVLVSSIEAELARDSDKPNYTAETLTALGAGSPPDAGLIFLIGSELVSGPNPQFGRWYRTDTILAMATLAICPRPGYMPNDRFLQSLVAGGADVVVLSGIHPPDISATELRAKLRAGVSPLALADQGVLIPSIARYLVAHDLYGGS